VLLLSWEEITMGSLEHRLKFLERMACHNHPMHTPVSTEIVLGKLGFNLTELQGIQQARGCSIASLVAEGLGMTVQEFKHTLEARIGVRRQR
jgi:hypothetical protein